MITTTELRELEEQAIENGIAAGELMENAGRHVFLATRKRYELDGKHIIVFCGTGNNGGDGLVAARYFAMKYPVVVLLFGDKEKFSTATQKNYDAIKKKVNVIHIQEKTGLEKFHVQSNHGLVLIDALLGIGGKGPLHNPISFAIDYFNTLPGFKVAVDVPSGLNPDTGDVKEKMCDVDLIVTFHDMKPGLQQFAEKTVVVDIGLPK
ncbi:MAG TPA: NAD(P)H-hydrate epimerase [Candidatus Nanoarchaeia archaeon]|nr:NAD(P)H-hydrate epimerase [Candidatus Nanoarchaeia archaeon]